MNKDSDVTQDRRVLWMINQIVSGFKPWLKKKELEKLDDDDTAQLFKEFLDQRDTRVLYATFTGASFSPYISLEAPVAGKRKIMYFLKRQQGMVRPENIHAMIECGEVHPKPLDSLICLERSINAVLFREPANLGPIPDVAHQQLLDKFHAFGSSLLVTHGLVDGKCQLPLPADPPSRGDLSNKDKLYSLESVVVSWTSQIKSAMTISPSSLFEPAHPVTKGSPTPTDEIAFWQRKAANLSFLQEQLASPEIIKVLTMLKKAGSSYYRPFVTLQDELREASLEALDNVRFLTPLSDGPQSPLQQMKATGEHRVPFEDLGREGVFERLFHYIYLLWSHSKYYNTPTCLVVFIREVCNELITSARQFVSIHDLFRIDPDEAVGRLTTSLSVCGVFKSCYFRAKGKAAKTSPRGPWRFQNTVLFSKLDAFLERCHDMLDVLETVMLFNRLDPEAARVIIGGNNGEEATAAISRVYHSFFASYKDFHETDLDLLDVDEPRFDAAFSTFRQKISDLEKQLTSILSSSLRESKSLSSVFKLVDSFDGFLSRSQVHPEWVRKQADIIREYHNDLILIQECFSAQLARERREQDPKSVARMLVSTAGEDGGVLPSGTKHFYERYLRVYDRMPPAVAKLVWAEGLLERADQPFEKIDELATDSVRQTEQWAEMVDLYSAVRGSLKEYIRRQSTSWAEGVGGTSQDKLRQNLLVRDSRGRLRVNFDVELAKLLREVTYLTALQESGNVDTAEVPVSAQHLHSQRDTLRKQVLKLDHIQNVYNAMNDSLLEVEQPLFSEELKNFNHRLSRGLNDLTWVNSEVDDFITSCTSHLQDLDATVRTLKKNVADITAVLKELQHEEKFLPLDPRDSKTLPVDDFLKKYQEIKRQRKVSAIKKSGEVAALMENGLLAVNQLKIQGGQPPLDTAEPRWQAYVSYVNSIVRDLVCGSVIHTLRCLLDQLDPAWLTKHSGIPLIDIKLILDKHPLPGKRHPHARFNPDLAGAPGALDSMVNEWVNDYKAASRNFSRLDNPADDFYHEVLGHEEIAGLAQRAMELVREAFERCREFKRKFDAFDFLWEHNMEESFAEFLGSGKGKDPVASPEGEGESEDGEGKGLDGAPGADEGAKATQEFERDFYHGLHLQDFHQAIALYEKHHDRILQLPEGTVINWLRIDAKPLKLALLDLCDKWRLMYVNFLTNRVRTELKSMYDFVREADKGLDLVVLENDLASLKEVMRWIQECKVRHRRTLAMFEPIGQVLDMLRRHTSVPEEVIAELEELRRDGPDTWNTLHKKSLNVREGHSKMQSEEADRVHEQSLAFQRDVAEFAEWFQGISPFTYLDRTELAYEELDRVHQALKKKEQQAEAIHHEQRLFDLGIMEFKLLRDCREQLRMLKGIWDLIAHVRAMFTSWYEKPFQEVIVDDLTDEMGKLQKQLKLPSTKARSWKCFEGLQSDIKRMALSLPLIQNIREKAMRKRHWDQFFEETGHAGLGLDPQSPSCTLHDLMSLDLHKYQEAVHTTVEKAMKEFQLETNLNRVIDTWAGQRFTYRFDEDLKAWLLGPVDDVVEVLDADSNLLQQMQSNRFVDVFQEPVSVWTMKLGKVEACIQLWMEVQKKWSNLFPIFVLSQDIRESLPTDARNFQVADELYRRLMDRVHKYTSVIQVCCTDSVRQEMERDDDLEGMLTIMKDILKACEKSLSDYLEAKKKTFPRFFFLADVDLVDILSKGSDPKKVMVHMSKIVDAIDYFNFSQVQGREKVVTEFVSIQKELVTMPEEYECTGPVEEWLSGCISAMQSTIRSKIDDANATYMEYPRTSWIHMYPCQAIIVASRVQFTWEAHTAFGQYEDGNETALKDFLRFQQKQLSDEIGLVLGDLNRNDRIMLVHLITIDVHNRDVVQWLIEEKAENDSHFRWQSQLRYYWEEKRGVVIRICDSELPHGYEYIGLCGCLVITKLTDRCYITLTQALRLVQGGAPAGPAGTGKTETTKDLARNLGVACYVFNCSDQMDYKGLGRIFKGLAMSGSWGCFDEFNRISIEVLSVVATQVSSILYGIRTRKTHFKFANEETISLNPSCGAFITMNPGYAGRTELPENIKSLFRPCAMVVPDIQNICEILLAAEGFVDAKELALKFVQLYRLNKGLLSQQLHYDWGLRAVKSVLVIAGNLKRADPQLNERNVLMRALRDTNMAKLSKDDVYVFKGLIKALFPNLTVSPKVDEDLKACCRGACEKLGLLRGDGDIFIEKCLQLDELLGVRHSVFVLGPAGCGKSQTCKALRGAYCIRNGGDQGTCRVRYLNPKALTANELYGFVHDQTKEWRDGHLAHIFKEYSMMSKVNECMKWIVLDGIIDAEWIESMNTVMDDNKMLTLANNDRIPLTPSMRMLFEISQLRNASPATVSRAGILFINESDLGWQPFKDRWLASRAEEKERNYLDTFFDAYVTPLFDEWKRAYKPIVTLVDINIVQTLCYLLEALLGHIPPGASQEVYEKYFCFAAVWAFGGPLPSTGKIDYRAAFSRNWIKDHQTRVRISDDKYQVFDYYLDPADAEFKPWSTLVKPYRHDPDTNFANIMVETVETTRLSYMMMLMVKQRKPVMLVGMAGTGKSQLVMDRMRSLDQTECIYRLMAFNAKTDPRTLQSVMESNLERGGRLWHPPARKKLVFFVDDINMPSPDKYGTQEPIALLRQFMDYGFWFDRSTPGQERHVSGIQFVSAMNHKSGTFTILDRLLRWFAVFAVCMPRDDDLFIIYNSILSGHWKTWGKDVKNLANNIVTASIEVHKAVSDHFLPTSVKFHYQWNLREMYNVFQGMCSTTKALHDNQVLLLCRLWRHECERTFRDRMVDERDQSDYDNLVSQVVAKNFGDLVVTDDVLAEPCLWGPFGQHGDDTDVYDVIDTFEQLSHFLERKLEEYNEDTLKARMDLVLFQQAMEHVCRICRILSNPCGNALLIGVGGSGKQSLSRLSAFISELDVYQILVTSTYSGADFRQNVADLYMKCGRKGFRYAFLLTDAHIVATDQLVVLNDMLNSGNVPSLFDSDQVEEVISAMVPELRQRQHPEYNNKDVCWDYFIKKVRANLHVVLCFSPVGQQLASWCRQFPAIANTTVIDWFHPWPEEALVSVARRFLSSSDSELAGNDNLIDSVSNHMAEAHLLVTTVAEDYRVKEKRYCYTTPKSYLELISTYKRLLKDKQESIVDRRRRLVDGVQKIKHAKEQVTELQNKLKEEDIEVRKASDECNVLMERMAADRAVCQEETERAEMEKEKTEKLLLETDALKADAERDLAAAQPLVEKAKAALKGLNKASLTELRSFTKPPAEVLMVTAAVMCLTSNPMRIPRPERAKDWGVAKKMMGNVTSWLKELEEFGATVSHNIPQPCIDAIQQWVRNPEFDAERMKSKSEAASCLAAWVTNMDAYHTLRCQIRPKELRLQEAQERLELSKIAFSKVQEQVDSLNARLNQLVASHDAAVEKSRALKTKAEATRLKRNTAERLVSGLADENIRWAKTIDDLAEREQLLVGDVLLAAAFISYLGPFNGVYRSDILENLQRDVKRRGLPHTEGLNIVTSVLTNEAEVAGWNNEGLPSDRVSTENGAVVKNAKRWPLLIDPQLQAAKWIKAREERHGLVVTNPSSEDCLSVISSCLERGLPCLLENLSESIDPVLEPVLGKAFSKKGSTWMCKMGDRDVIVDIGSFRLYLQTKLPNPHYKPELHAQTTLVNFSVTDTGLEDQLLAVVVNKERPDLEEHRVTLIRQMNQYKIDLATCEDKLLFELSNATGDLLENVALIDNLEHTKKQASMIAKALVEDRAAQNELVTRRLVYKNVATRGSLLYFEIDQLAKIDSMYQYSLEAFMVVFNKALDKAEWPSVGGNEDRTNTPERVEKLTVSVTETLFAFVSRGLFERHKLIFSSLLCFSILRNSGEVDSRQLEFLLTGGRKKPTDPIPDGLQEWCTPAMWSAVHSLVDVPGPAQPNVPQFAQLAEDLTQHNRWRLWTEYANPEEEKLPTDWRGLTSFQRLLILRCLRPDRLTAALHTFVGDKLGKFFVTDRAVPLAESFKDAGPTTPIFFILSPGVDPIRKVEALASSMRFTYDRGNLHNVSLGQGQEGKATAALEQCFHHGGWAMLSNIHLTKRWLLDLEKLLDSFAAAYTKKEQAEKAKKAMGEPQFVVPVLENDDEATSQGDAGDDPGQLHTGDALQLTPSPAEGSEEPDLPGHPDFRVFLTAEPVQGEVTIPIGILQRSIKLTNEPPSGIQANMTRALSEFKSEPWENSCKPSDFKAVLFSMCWFHSIVVERKKFGKIGWNRVYPFNVGDLNSCIDVLKNYIEERPQVPYEDLRYVFGEIMYGGHITDDWDRRLCSTYLEQYIRPDYGDNLELCPGYQVPQFSNLEEALKAVHSIPPESPAIYGIHSNAEMGYRIEQAESLFRTVNELQPKNSAMSDGKDPVDKVQQTIDEILNVYLFDSPHHLVDIMERLEDDRTPQQHVFYQECERMNILQCTVRDTLLELNMGLNGSLSMSDAMQQMFTELLYDKLPEKWQEVSYPSTRMLGSWCQNLVARNTQLVEWTSELITPKVTRLDYFFNPMSFLTAIAQNTAMQNSYDLDQMDLVCEPLKRMIDGIDHTAREGSHVFGIHLEGARWETSTGTMEDSKVKELHCVMPVVTIRAFPQSKVDRKDQYCCPLYQTQARGPTYVTSLWLRTKQPASKWVIAGVAAILDVVEV